MRPIFPPPSLRGGLVGVDGRWGKGYTGLRLIILRAVKIGAWRSLVARLLWEQKVPGSSPGAPTKTKQDRRFRTMGSHESYSDSPEKADGHPVADAIAAFLISRGGEEFVLILPDASLKDTVARAEHLQESARSLDVVHRGRPLGHVTLSLGVAMCPKHGVMAETLIRAADTAWYRAKQHGRARTEGA